METQSHYNNITTTSSQPLKPSPLTTLIESSNSQTSPLTLQVSHNLLYQHQWTSLTMHASATQTYPFYLISGLPPRRIYIHPDEQIHMLENGIDEAATEVEREWVVPTRIGDKDWTLRKLAGIFDGIPERESGEKMRINGQSREEGEGGTADVDAVANGAEKADKGSWGGKRLLLAVVDGDSTVVYYIVHDGIVKPRQN